MFSFRRVDNGIAGVLEQHGVGMIVHTVVTGGANGLRSGLDQHLKAIPATRATAEA